MTDEQKNTNEDEAVETETAETPKPAKPAKKPRAKKAAPKAEAAVADQAPAATSEEAEEAKPKPARKPRAKKAAPKAEVEEAVAEEAAADETVAEPQAEEPTEEPKAEEPTDTQTTSSSGTGEPQADTQTTSSSGTGEPQAVKPPRTAPARKRDQRRELPAGVEVRAQAKYVRTSARKARLVCDHIRGKDVAQARAILAFTPRAAAKDWAKLLESAVANAEHNHELVGEDLKVAAVYADEGPTLKRYRPRAMGRATRIRKRTSHLTITLTPKEL
jgi:ribosomal protein L22